MIALSSSEGRAVVMLDHDNLSVAARHYKIDVGSGASAVCFLPEPHNALAVAQKRNGIFLFSLKQQQPLHKCFTSERIGALGSTPCGSYLLGAGGETGTLYLWHLSTGDLLKVANAHFRPIVDMSVSFDGSMVATASEDATCRVWSLASLINEASPSPLATFAAHTLPLTACAFFPTLPQWVATTSMDRSVRVFDSMSGTQITSVTLPSPVTAMRIHQGEQLIACGCSNGSIGFVDLYPKARPAIDGMGRVWGTSSTAVAPTAAFPAGLLGSKMNAPGDLEPTVSVHQFDGSHKHAVVGLGFGFTGADLVSVCRGGLMLTWAVGSRQVTHHNTTTLREALSGAVPVSLSPAFVRRVDPTSNLQTASVAKKELAARQQEQLRSGLSMSIDSSGSQLAMLQKFPKAKAVTEYVINTRPELYAMPDVPYDLGSKTAVSAGSVPGKPQLGAKRSRGATEKEDDDDDADDKTKELRKLRKEVKEYNALCNKLYGDLRDVKVELESYRSAEIVED